MGIASRRGLDDHFTYWDPHSGFEAVSLVTRFGWRILAPTGLFAEKDALYILHVFLEP